MKFPENKKEQIKILGLIGMGTIGVLYMVVQLGITPLIKSTQARKTTIKELEKELRKVSGEVAKIPGNCKKNYETLRNIKEITDKYVLQPRLGNYLLGVTEIVENHARDIDIELELINEIGIFEIPRSSGLADNTFKCYRTRVTLECGFRNIVRFLRAIETANPYLCVANLEITGQPEEYPEKHKIKLNIEWPIWSDSTMPNKLEKQMKEKGKR